MARAMLTLLHISDLHFGPPYVERVGAALLRKVPQVTPDVIVVSGDLTQRAKREQFRAAREFLQQLPDVPRVVVPGNHDVPLYRVLERITNPLGLYRELISHELDQVLRVDGATIVALNSTSPHRAITNGRIRSSQMAFCRDAFAESPHDAARIVVAHHHFAPAPDYESDQTMPQARRAMDFFLKLGVDMILGGHLHRAYIGNSLDIYPGGRQTHGIIIVQCGTTTSRRGRGRERERNTFNLIKIGEEMLRITHYMYFDDLGEFGPVSRHIFPRAGKRFVEGTLHTPD
jgi:3',5'-cyclic AMP phosphodiesterase CpdA